MIIAAAFVFIVGAIVSAAAPDTAVLTIARVVIGVAIGFASATAPVYISEMAPPDIRGRLVTMFQLSVTIGILVAYLVGLAFEPSERLALDARPRRAAGAGARRSACCGCRSSPRWLVMVGRDYQARATLREDPRRRRRDAIDAEIAEIKDSGGRGARSLERAAERR